MDVPLAEHADLVWADAYAFGSPTRYGNVAAQLKQSIDSTGQLWMNGSITGRAATAFTSAINMHGGNESTLLALAAARFQGSRLVAVTGKLLAPERN
jgi:NAD(P)H dehydrogenase (quinone)